MERKDTARVKGRKLSKEEFRSILPKKINKLGEWVLANSTAWDYGNGRIILK